MRSLLRLCAAVFAQITMILALGGLVVTPAMADVGSEMNSYFNSAGTAANVTGPSAFNGQSAGYYSGGSLWSRFPSKTINPVRVKEPVAKARFCEQVPTLATAEMLPTACNLIRARNARGAINRPMARPMPLTRHTETVEMCRSLTAPIAATDPRTEMSSSPVIHRQLRLSTSTPSVSTARPHRSTTRAGALKRPQAMQRPTATR